MTPRVAAICASWLSLTGLVSGEELATNPELILLTPAPKRIQWTTKKLFLGEVPVIEVRAAQLEQVARLLAAEMRRLWGLHAEVVLVKPEEGETQATVTQAKLSSCLPDNSLPCETFGRPTKDKDQRQTGRIKLLLRDSPEGQARLAAIEDWFRWPPPRNPQEGYALCINEQEAWLVAETVRGCLYGGQTLLQMIRAEPTPNILSHHSPGGGPRPPDAQPSVPSPPSSRKPPRSGRLVWLPGVQIVDWPQLPFRGVHLCIFPNTELPAIRQAILWAARFKCNAVVIEPWASLQSRRRPETAYAYAYHPEEVRPLVLLGQALHMEMIPMLNSWGHASGMRSRTCGARSVSPVSRLVRKRWVVVSLGQSRHLRTFIRSI